MRGDCHSLVTMAFSLLPLGSMGGKVPGPHQGLGRWDNLEDLVVLQTVKVGCWPGQSNLVEVWKELHNLEWTLEEMAEKDGWNRSDLVVGNGLRLDSPVLELTEEVTAEVSRRSLVVVELKHLKVEDVSMHSFFSTNLLCVYKFQRTGCTIFRSSLLSPLSTLTAAGMTKRV